MKLNIIYRRSKMAQLVNGQADDCCAALFSCSWDVSKGLCIYAHTLLNWEVYTNESVHCYRTSFSG